MHAASFTAVHKNGCKHLSTVLFLIVLFHLVKNGSPSKMEWPHFSTGSREVNAPSAEGPWGLGDWRRMLRFSTAAWQVPGSEGFVGSERETKHHLWNCNLIDWCSHYPVEFLMPLRKRRSEEEEGGKRGGNDMELTELNGAKPLKSSATAPESRQAAETDNMLTERNPHWVFHLHPPHSRCWVLKWD